MRKIEKLGSTPAILMMLAALGSAARADDMAYMVNESSQFGIIDLNTGVFTELGVINIPSYVPVGLGIAGGKLYTAGYTATMLYEVNPASGAVNAVGSGSLQYYGLGSTTTGLYALGLYINPSNNAKEFNLYSVDPSSGATTLIGPVGTIGPFYAWSLSTGASTLYLADLFNLYSLNTNTGAATLIGSPPTNLTSAALVYKNGTLYAGVDSCNPACNESVWTLSTISGAGTFVANTTNTSAFQGLAPTCTFSVNVQQISAPAGGLSGAINVTTNLSDCSWSATSNVPWLSVVSGTSGQGNGTVDYSVSQNDASARMATLTIAGQTVTVSQAAAAGVGPSIAIIAGSATGTSPFAAGQLISIYGSQLGPVTGTGLQLGPGGVVSSSNSGTQVLFDSTPAPIIYTSAGQVNAVIPCAVAGHSSTQLVVEYMGAQSAPLVVPLSPAAPGIFTADGSGKGGAAALNQDNSFNSPSNPAPRGSIVTFYATGVGPTSPCVDGQVYQSNFPTLTLPVIVGVGPSGAQVQYAGQAPDLVSGVAQFDVVIPSDTPSGVIPLTLVVGGLFSTPGVTIAVK